MIARDGVSVIVCTHNGAKRIPQVLRHIADQVLPGRVPCELVVVDNGSNDGTVGVVQDTWGSLTTQVDLRIVTEPKLGLIHARIRGVSEAHYDLIFFVDDDNWLSPGWISRAHGIMETHPAVAACGGRTEGSFEEPPPAWFSQYHEQYAIGEQGQAHGDVTACRGYLWGAGLAVRRQAWERLWDAGFRPELTGRSGRRLLAGDDAELCFALVLSGWSLWYDPALHLRHFMPRARLQWSYLRRMYRGFGAMSVTHDAYRAEMQGRVLNACSGEVKACLCELWRQRSVLRRSARGELAGDRSVIAVDHCVGRLRELVRQRGAYGRRQRMLRDAAWRESGPRHPDCSSGGAR